MNILALGGAGFNFKTAGAGNLGLVGLGMDIVFHYKLLYEYRVAKRLSQAWNTIIEKFTTVIEPQLISWNSRFGK